MKSIRGIRTVLVVAAIVLAGALTACSKGSAASPGGSPSASSPAVRLSSTAQLAIVSPKNGQVIAGSSVDLRVSLKGARIVPATTTHLVPDQGHLHVFLDNQIVSMTFGLNQTIPGVSPGQHVLRVEFVASDHGPFDPRVFVSVVFEVRN
ncbi:MAG TPA: hypothetical protein VJ010_01690 [Actinomycetota bacterium]|nr:hypothetical protein [Actinomycetota bacterium]